MLMKKHRERNHPSSHLKLGIIADLFPYPSADMVVQLEVVALRIRESSERRKENEKEETKSGR
tara:strand:- start:37 stop:225 length:189 start_codon:yes stop_codon:yes gene_type:complete